MSQDHNLSGPPRAHLTPRRPRHHHPEEGWRPGRLSEFPEPARLAAPRAIPSLAPTIPTTEPTSLRAGETWAWDVEVPDFPPSGGWSLRYHFVGPTTFHVDATASGETYQVRIDAATSGTRTAGEYQWIAQAVQGSDVYPTGRAGALTIEPDFATIGNRESHAAKMLALLESAIEAHLTGSMAGVEDFSINGRSVSRYSLAELRALRAQYAQEVEEQRALASGGSLFTPIEAHFRAPA